MLEYTAVEIVDGGYTRADGGWSPCAVPALLPMSESINVVVDSSRREGRAGSTAA